MVCESKPRPLGATQQQRQTHNNNQHKPPTAQQTAPIWVRVRVARAGPPLEAGAHMPRARHKATQQTRHITHIPTHITQPTTNQNKSQTLTTHNNSDQFI